MSRRPGDQTICYSDLVAQLPIGIAPDDPRLSILLDEVSRQTYDEGRGFLTVLVVHKRGDMRPGNGFFEMAELCGETVEDRDAFYWEQFARVLRIWGAR